MKTKKAKIESFLLLSVLSLIWGSSFILMKKGMLAFSAPQVASLRIIFSGLIFLPYVLLKYKEIPWKKLNYIILFGLLEVGIPPFLYTFAQTHVDSSTAGILNSLVPLFTLFAGLIIFRLKYHWLTTLGVLIGLIGAFLITFVRSSGSHTSFHPGNVWGLLIVLATLLYGIAGNLLNEKLSDISSTMITAISFVSMTVPATILLAATDIFTIPINQTQGMQSFLAILTLSVFGSALAIVLFSKLIKLSNPLFASFVTYLIPFVALVWGWLDGENMTYITFISMFIIFSGIYIANKGIARIKS